MPAPEAGFFMPKIRAPQVESSLFASAGKWGEVVENGVKGSKVGN